MNQTEILEQKNNLIENFTRGVQQPCLSKQKKQLVNLKTEPLELSSLRSRKKKE